MPHRDYFRIKLIVDFINYSAIAPVRAAFRTKVVTHTDDLRYLKGCFTSRVAGKIEGYPHLAYQLDA